MTAEVTIDVDAAQIDDIVDRWERDGLARRLGELTLAAAYRINRSHIAGN